MQIVLWTIEIYFINTYNSIVLQIQRNRTQRNAPKIGVPATLIVLF